MAGISASSFTQGIAERVQIWRLGRNWLFSFKVPIRTPYNFWVPLSAYRLLKILVPHSAAKHLSATHFPQF